MEKLYVLHLHTALDFEIYYGVKLYRTRERAEKELASEFESEYKLFQKEINKEFLSVEDGNTSWAIYEEGNYPKNHSEAWITEEPIGE